MWTPLTCRVCKEEFADSDITMEEIEKEIDLKTDTKGSYLIVCEECY